MMPSRGEVRALVASYPSAYQQAIARVKQLEASIESLEDEEDEREPRVSKEVRKKQREIISLEADIDRLKVDLEHAKGTVYAVHQESYPKATISSVDAVVHSDKEVVALKQRMVDLQEKKKLLDLDILELQDAQPSMYQANHTLEETERELAEAEAAVEAVKMSLEVYRLLLQFGEGE
jgi:chromosome segregation ATPase